MGTRVKLHALYEVHWLDAVGYVMEDLDKVKPAKCRTVGWIKAIKDDHIVVASSLYDDSHGDFTVLPKGMICKTILREGK